MKSNKIISKIQKLENNSVYVVYTNEILSYEQVDELSEMLKNETENCKFIVLNKTFNLINIDEYNNELERLGLKIIKI